MHHPEGAGLSVTIGFSLMLWALNLVVAVSLLTMMVCLIWSMTLMSQASPSKHRLFAVRRVGLIAAVVGLISMIWRQILR